MTNVEKLEEVIKETFPDIFENEPSFTVTIDFCNIIRCDDRSCQECYLDRVSDGTSYGFLEYKGPNNSNNNSSNTKVAITSGEISW